MRVLEFDLQRAVRRLASALPPYAAALVLLLFAQLAAHPLDRSQLPVLSAERIGADGRAHPLHDYSYTPPEGGYETIRFAFEAPDRVGAPMAVYLSGLFSAEARWNGVALGGKGSPGGSPALERPGPIDAVLPIPASVLRPGRNALELRLSAQHLNYPVGSILHAVNGRAGVSVAPYSADRRRPLVNYTAPIVMLGALALALVALAKRRSPIAERLGPLLLAGALTMTALAEVSRALFDYAYTWHAWRLAALVASSAATSFALLQTALEWTGLKPRREVFAAFAVLAIAILLGSNAFDQRCLLLISAGAAAAGAVAVKGAYDGKRGCLDLAAACFFLLLFAMFDAGNFLDRSLYAAAAPVLALLVLQRDATAPAPAHRIAVGGAGRRRLVALAELAAVHGAGNYTEFALIGGEHILDERKLATVAAQLPSNFRRVHRSHIVNLDLASAMLTLGAGSFAIEMANGARVPVSRRAVNDVRAVFETGGLSARPSAD